MRAAESGHDLAPRKARAPEIQPPTDVRSQLWRGGRATLWCPPMKRGRFFRGLALLSTVLLLGACDPTARVDDAAEDAVAASSDPGGGGPGLMASDFGPCPPGYQTECAFLDVPLDHGRAGGPTIRVHLARRRGSAGSARQLWLLAGGPGQAGEIWNATVTGLAARMPDTDIYVLDHRGTGRSHRLTCAAQDVPGSAGGYVLDPEDVPSCLDELRTKGDLDRLPFFTTRQAAGDLARAIRATRAPGQKVHVWGGSYGTHLAHRFLQLEPDLADGVVFDGYMTPSRFAFVDYDRGVEEVGTLFAAGCAADRSCAAHLGGDPREKARAILAGLDARPCGVLDRATARTWASVFLDGFYSRALVFPLLHRLERCSEADRAAIDHLVVRFTSALGGGAASPRPSADAAPAATYTGSGILQYNIVLSELWNLPGRPEPTVAALTAAADAQVFLAARSYPASIAHLRATWPLPPDDASSLPLPVPAGSRTAQLWLAGGLDTRTPPSQSALLPGLYPTQPMVLLPGAAHTPGAGSPLATDPLRSCGSTIAEGFVTRGVVDTACVADLAPVWYDAPYAPWASYWWGDADDWGDAAEKPADPGRVAPDPASVTIDPCVPSRLALRALGRRR